MSGVSEWQSIDPPSADGWAGYWSCIFDGKMLKMSDSTKYYYSNHRKLEARNEEERGSVEGYMSCFVWLGIEIVLM